MSDINEVHLTGVILKEPNLRRTRSENMMCSFQISVKRKEPSRSRDFLDIVVWEPLASEAGNAYHAGDRVSIRGRLQKTNYVGSDGRKRVTTQIVAEQMEGLPQELFGEQNDAMESAA